MQTNFPSHLCLLSGLGYSQLQAETAKVVMPLAMYMPVDEVLGDQVQMITPPGNRISGWLHRTQITDQLVLFSH